MLSVGIKRPAAVNSADFGLNCTTRTNISKDRDFLAGRVLGLLKTSVSWHTG